MMRAPTPTPLVRPADFDDVGPVAALGAAFAAEARLPVPFDRATAEATVAASIADPARCAFVAATDGGVVGAILGWCGPSPLHAGREVHEIAFFVARRARGGLAGPLLLDAFLGWAAAQGAALVAVQALAGTRAGALYRRRGFAPAAEVWVR